MLFFYSIFHEHEPCDKIIVQHDDQATGCSTSTMEDHKMFNIYLGSKFRVITFNKDIAQLDDHSRNITYILSIGYFIFIEVLVM